MTFGDARRRACFPDTEYTRARERETGQPIGKRQHFAGRVSLTTGRERATSAIDETHRSETETDFNYDPHKITGSSCREDAAKVFHYFVAGTLRRLRRREGCPGAHRRHLRERARAPREHTRHVLRTVVR